MRRTPTALLLTLPWICHALGASGPDVLAHGRFARRGTHLVAQRNGGGEHRCGQAGTGQTGADPAGFAIEWVAVVDGNALVSAGQRRLGEERHEQAAVPLRPLVCARVLALSHYPGKGTGHTTTSLQTRFVEPVFAEPPGGRWQRGSANRGSTAPRCPIQEARRAA